LSWGVPYDVFFTLNPNTLRPFEEAYKIKCREDADAMNYSSWLIGRYVCASISACFGRGRKYPEEPFKRRDEEDENGYVLTDADRFKAFALAYNAQKQKKIQHQGGGVMNG